DQAGRHVGQPYLHLATRPLLPQRDSATPIEADDVKPVLADIDTDGGDHTLQDLRHGVLLSFGASCQPTCRQGQEHGRTIPLAEMKTQQPRYSRASTIVQCTRKACEHRGRTDRSRATAACSSEADLPGSADMVGP